MSDYPDNLRIRPLEDKRDYRLWNLRVLAAIYAKILLETFFPSTDRDVSNNQDDFRAGRNLMLSVLNDQALRLVRDVIGSPFEIVNNLDKRYASKTTDSRMAKISELVSTRYYYHNEDM